MQFERACILMTWGSEKGAGQPNELIRQQSWPLFTSHFQVVLNISSNLYCIQVSLLCTIKKLYNVICQDNVLTKEIIPAV